MFFCKQFLAALQAQVAQVAAIFLQSAPRCLFQITLPGLPRSQGSLATDTEEGQMVKIPITNTTTITLQKRTSLS